MASLLLHEFHQARGARFLDLNGQEAVAHYGDALAEHAALVESAGIMDLSYRGRLCVLGADRAKFLHGQVTNNIKDLRTGEGCYAALVSAKGKIQSDLHIYILENEILLDFEPGFTDSVQKRLEKYIIAEDAQIAGVSAHYGLWSIQGPNAAAVIKALPWKFTIPTNPHSFTKLEDPMLGEIYLTNHPRIHGANSETDPLVPRSGERASASGASCSVLTARVAGSSGSRTTNPNSPGYDLFIPNAAMRAAANALATAAAETGARFCGWQALETARIEAGIPRFGADIDETNLAPEVFGPEAISYSKGCYIGQEIIARIRTYGQVAKSLRGLCLPDNLPSLPVKGDKLFLGDKEIGYLTSAAASPLLKANIALAYIRREANQTGTELLLQTSSGKVPVKIADLPFLPQLKSAS